MLECTAVEWAAQRITPGECCALGDSLERMGQAIFDDDVEALALADADFHATLIAAAHNTLLATMHLQVALTLRQHISRNTFQAAMAPASASLAQRRLEQHTAIHAAIRDGLPSKAMAATRSHILFVQDQLR